MAAPIIDSAITVDGNSDGTIDRIDITSSEPIQSADPNPKTKFHLATIDPTWVTVSISGAAVSGSTVRLTLASTPPGTAVPGDLTVAMDPDPSAVRDTSPAHNFTAWPAYHVTDGVAPELMSLVSQDVDQNGTLDQIVATFSEPVVASTDPTKWTLQKPGWPSALRASVAGA
jgi:hypothetical protein